MFKYLKYTLMYFIDSYSSQTILIMMRQMSNDFTEQFTANFIQKINMWVFIDYYMKN